MSGVSPEFDAWADKARAVSVEEVAFDRYRSLKIKKSSEGWQGECPKCGGVDRFAINIKKNVWNCRGCDKGGDAIALVMNAEGLEFIQAVTEITGEMPPKREAEAPGPIVEDTAAKARVEERRDREVLRESDEQKKRRETLERVVDLWAGLKPFKSSHAEAYLLERKIRLFGDQADDLRFAPALEYRGFASADAPGEEPLGKFPAMVAAIRDSEGAMIGIHRTYLDSDKPVKLVPPGDRAQNLAKKVYGFQRGGHIRLGAIREAMAMGEGIETTASWYSLGIGPEDVGIMAGINLGNICGGSAGTLPHPRMLTKTIPNGEPDPERPGVILPPGIKTLILLGDSDSEPYFTRANMLAAGRRFRADGVEVLYCWPNDREDFNDILRGQAA